MVNIRRMKTDSKRGKKSGNWEREEKKCARFHHGATEENANSNNWIQNVPAFLNRFAIAWCLKMAEKQTINKTKERRETYTHDSLLLIWKTVMASTFMSYAYNLAWSSVLLFFFSLLLSYCMSMSVSIARSDQLNFCSQGRKKAMNQMWDKKNIVQGMPKDNAPMSWNILAAPTTISIAVTLNLYGI